MVCSLVRRWIGADDHADDELLAEHAKMMKGIGTLVGALTALMFFNHFTYGIAIQVCIVLAAVALVVSIKANAYRTQQ
jgi:hypothetical protein